MTTDKNDDSPARTLRKQRLGRFSIPVLLSRFDEKKVISVTTAINGGLAILAIGVFAWLTKLPLIFPALGPSAFILFSRPLSDAAAPRNVIMGHLICMAVGYGVWQLMGVLSGEPVAIENMGLPLFCGAALTLAICAFLLVLLDWPHPPACASALVIVLGAVTAPRDIALMAVVVVWLTYQAVITNKLFGMRVPSWSPRKEDMP